MSTHLIGDPVSVTEGLRQLEARTGADEIMLSTRSHTAEARVQSLSLIARAWAKTSVSDGANGRQGVATGAAAGTASD